MTGFLDAPVIEGSSYQVQRSLRFRGSAAAYLSRTFAAGNQSTWTMSFWLKRATIGLQNVMQAGGAGGSVIYIGNDNALHLSLTLGAGETRVTSALLRDPTAWHHIVVSLDTTQAIAANRVTVTVNGVVQTSFSTSGDPVLNSTFSFNGATGHTIGQATAQVGGPLDGYVTSAILVSGQQLPASSFGEFNSSGQWWPKAYSGSYGTTGFNLSFADPTNLTTLVSDSSGNGNNWTANNISLTAGVTYDSMLDAPLGGGGERGNYCTWNPLDSNTSKPTNGNLRVGHNAGEGTRATQFNSVGKWYYEFQYDTITSGADLGIATSAASLGTYPGAGATSYGFSPNTGNKNNAGVGAAYGASHTTSDVVSVAYDLDNGKIWWAKNGVWQASGDPAAGTNAAYTGLAGAFAPMLGIDPGGGGNGGYANFGQRPFAYTPPAGFKALHTGNLTNTTPLTSGSFTGNAVADGPLVWCNGTPETLTVNGNAVTWGTHADKLASGFKLRTSSSSYNASGTNSWTATYLSPADKSAFKYQLAKGNP